MSTVEKKTKESNNLEVKKSNTFNDFYTFCSFILAYEEQVASGGSLNLGGLLASEGAKSGLGSAGESNCNTSSSSDSDSSDNESKNTKKRKATPIQCTDEEGSESSSDSSDQELEYSSDDESWNLVTCFCGRPFAGRPMIECSQCLTWIHLFCAKIRKDNVPEVFMCQLCKKKNKTAKKRKL